MFKFTLLYSSNLKHCLFIIYSVSLISVGKCI